MEPLRLFYEVVDDPIRYAIRWKEAKHGKVIGSFCSYVPEEIILAADALCFRIFATGRNMYYADKHLQTYCCNFVRGALNDALSGKLDFLDGAVFPHTCDSIQRLSDIWRINTKFGFHADVGVPVKLNAESAQEYMVHVLKAFKKELAKALDTEITEESLITSVETYNNIRRCLQRIYEIRSKYPGSISGIDVHTIAKASMVMDRNILSQALPRVLQWLEKNNQRAQDNKKRLVVSGGICNMPEIYQMIEDAGGAVVWDDLCTGYRYVEGAIDTKGDIIESIAKRYVNKGNCPAKHSGILNRGKELVEKVKQNRAQGVMFILLKFCDPHAFDYPYIKMLLEKEGIPSMLVEMEEQLPSEGQFRTRCEAFLEMI